MAGKVKKIFRDKFGVIGEAEREALKSELSDVLWYIAQVCTELEISLDEVAERNIAKLSDRLERGKIGGDGSFGILAPVGVYNYLDLAGIPGEYFYTVHLRNGTRINAENADVLSLFALKKAFSASIRARPRPILGFVR